MEITASQSVQVHGFWQQPRTTLAWEDIRISEHSWRQLRNMGFTAAELHALQPNAEDWIARGKVNLEDLRDMTLFPVNPFTDFKADLAEVWGLKLTVPELLNMKVTYQQFCEAGMTHEIMFHFNLTLSQWFSLGLRSVDVATLPEHKSPVLFSMDKATVLEKLIAFEKSFENKTS